MQFINANIKSRCLLKQIVQMHFRMTVGRKTTLVTVECRVLWLSLASLLHRQKLSLSRLSGLFPHELAGAILSNRRLLDVFFLGMYDMN